MSGHCHKCGYPMPCAHHKPTKPPLTGARLLSIAVMSGVADMQNCAEPFWENALSSHGREVWERMAELIVEEMKP